MTLARHTPLKRTPFKAKAKPLKRTRMQRRPPPPRTRDEGGDPAYLERVRGLPCCARNLASRCGGAVQAHHHTHDRGMSRKADDSRAMPLCAGHHGEFHAAAGAFKVLNQEARRVWQDEQVEHTRAALAATEDETFPH